MSFKEVFSKNLKVLKQWPKTVLFWHSIAELLGYVFIYLASNKVNQFGAWVYDLLMPETNLIDKSNTDFSTIGIIAIIVFFLFFTLINLTSFLAFKSKKRKKENIKKNELINLQSKKLEYTESLKLIEEIAKVRVINDYDALGKLIVNHLPFYLTVLPITTKFLLENSESPMIILTVRTKIHLHDYLGKSASVTKSIWFLPFDSNHNKVLHNFSFDKDTKINRVIEDDELVTDAERKERTEITENGINYVHHKKIKPPIIRFGLKNAHIRFDLINCFKKEVEFWTFSRMEYPICYDTIEIKLVRKPSSHRCLVWNIKRKRWVIANNLTSVLLKNGDFLENGLYTISYFLNYQDLSKDESKFRVEWSY